MSKEEEVVRPNLVDLKRAILKNRATVIIGRKCSPGSFNVTEETKTDFNRKNMVKNPKVFWEWYGNNVYSLNPFTDEQKAVINLLDTGYFSSLINMDTTFNYPGLNPVNLKGLVDQVRCMSCGTWSHYKKGFFANGIAKCSCGGKISPSVIMFDEKYRQEDTDRIKDIIFKEEADGKVSLNTNVLILIGVDFNEDYVDELIESFSAIKNQSEEEAYLVIVGDMDGFAIDRHQADFATYEDIAGSVNRLVSKLEEINE